MKALIKQLIPPLLLEAINRASKPRSTEVIRYPTYQEATLACQQDAYQNNDLVKVVVEKNLIYRNKLNSNPIFELGSLRTFIALGACHKVGRLNVIDFGGAGGYHYTIANAALGFDASIRWHVVETSAMSEEAQKLASDKLKFFDDISKAQKSLGEVDLVFTSGALQYCPDPLTSLRKLTEINAPYLFITRTPLLDGYGEIVTTQTSNLSSNGPGPLPSGFEDRTIIYPITYVSKIKVEEILNERYDIRFKTDESDGGFRFGNEPISMTGYFCVRRPSNVVLPIVAKRSKTQ